MYYGGAVKLTKRVSFSDIALTQDRDSINERLPKDAQIRLCEVESLAALGQIRITEKHLLV